MVDGNFVNKQHPTSHSAQFWEDKGKTALLSRNIKKPKVSGQLTTQVREHELMCKGGKT